MFTYNNEVAILCIDLGIPLKDIKNYVNTDGELEFEHLLKDGKKLAKEKIKKIESSIDSINRTLQHINAKKHFRDAMAIIPVIFLNDIILQFPVKQSWMQKNMKKI